MAGTCYYGNEPSGSIKCGEIFWLAENRLASPEGLFYIELVGWLVVSLVSSNKWLLCYDLIMNFHNREDLYLTRYDGDAITVGYGKRLTVRGVASFIDFRNDQSKWVTFIQIKNCKSDVLLLITEFYFISSST